MQYPYRGRHAINRSARLAEQALRLEQTQAGARPVPAAQEVVHVAIAVPLRVIDLLDALGRLLQQIAATARSRLARSPPQSGLPWP